MEVTSGKNAFPAPSEITDVPERRTGGRCTATTPGSSRQMTTGSGSRRRRFHPLGSAASAPAIADRAEQAQATAMFLMQALPGPSSLAPGRPLANLRTRANTLGCWFTR
jgi:hypothetical protein